MCDQTGNNRRTFNRELDLESGMWEEAIRREERAKVLSEVEELKQIPDEIPEPVLEPHDEYNWDWRVCKLCGEKNIGDRAYLEHMRRKHGLSKKTTSKYYNQAIDDVLAKLNQLKGKNE